MYKKYRTLNQQEDFIPLINKNIFKELKIK